jgi:hypothetical protein
LRVAACARCTLAASEGAETDQLHGIAKRVPTFVVGALAGPETTDSSR